MSIYGFLKIKAKVQPLEQALLQIKEEASGLEIRRAEIMVELVEMEKNIDSLTAECSECEAHQIRLQNQADECENNTKQATIITELLSDEIKRWTEQQAGSEHLGQTYGRRAPGSVLRDLCRVLHRQLED